MIVRMTAGGTNCGIVAVQIATGKTYSEIKNAWAGGWDGNDSGTLMLPNDTPEDHYATLEKLGIPYHRINVNDVLNGNAVPGKTVLLLHDAAPPRNFLYRIINLVRGFFVQHWVVFKGMDDYGRFIIDWGFWKTSPEGKQIADIRTFSRDKLHAMLKGSYPRAAYIVGEGTAKQHWFWKWWANFT